MAKRKRNKKIPKVLIVAAVLLLLVLSFVVYTCYFRDTVASGVTVGGVDIGGMTKAQAEKAISANAAFPENEVVLKLSYKGESVKLKPSELDIQPDVPGAVEKAYAIGKSGGIFSRLADILSAKFGGEDMLCVVKADSGKLTDALQPFYDVIENPVVQAESELSEDEIVITPGKAGNDIDRDKLMEDIAAAMYGKKSGQIKLSVKKQEPFSASAKDVHAHYRTDVRNAEYIMQADGTVGITQSVVGVDFSLETAERKIKEAKGGKIVIPVKVTEPEVSFDELEEKLYADTLSSYDSWYTPGNSGRNINLELACSKMAGVELMPGDVFSYTGTIGNGTYEEGYVDAPVYSGGEIETGVGGGICQGSSTLYCAVLFADLEIVERVNHSMPVGYVPAGMDATIATPTIDFKFRNSTEYPIRLDVSCGGGYLSIAIQGTVTDPDKNVEISNQLVSTTDFEVKEVINEALAEGEEIVKQNGSNGSVVETYKTVTVNGQSSTKLISTSRYNPIPKIVEVSKEKEDAEEETEETENAEDEPSEEQPASEAPEENTGAGDAAADQEPPSEV